MEGFFIVSSIMFFTCVIIKQAFTHKENVERIRKGYDHELAMKEAIPVAKDEYVVYPSDRMN